MDLRPDDTMDLDQLLRHCTTTAELRATLQNLIEHRELLRDFELARLEERAGEILEDLRDLDTKRLEEELLCFRDILDLHRRLHQL